MERVGGTFETALALRSCMGLDHVESSVSPVLRDLAIDQRARGIHRPTT